MPKKAKPKGFLEQLIDSYNKLDKDDKAIVGVIGLLISSSFSRLFFHTRFSF